MRGRRRQPSQHRKNQLLAQQENACFWCQREFGAQVSRKGKVFVLQPQWDHYFPLSITHRNSDDQFVAACQTCNAHKASLMISEFFDEHDMRMHLMRVIEKETIMSLSDAKPVVQPDDTQPVMEPPVSPPIERKRPPLPAVKKRNRPQYPEESGPGGKLAGIGMTQEEFADLERYAESRGFVTVNVLLRAALAEYIRRHKPNSESAWALRLKELYDV